MRVDVCSTETLKRLKDKAGGKKFSKDFEEASAKLEEFVGILDKQVKNGPSLPEALENAGIFYEAQYREVKVVVNAYKTFANRVNNLKKKLDQLKATLPDPEESPMPSPTIDAPSPTGSESPFQGMGDMSPLSPEVEPVPSDSPEAPKDNRMVEDMELSDVDADEEMPEIIVEEMKEPSESPASSVKDADDSPVTAQPSDVTAAAPTETPTPSPSPAASSSAPAQVVTSTTTAATSAPVTPALPKTVTTPAVPPSMPLALPNLANVDLGKISSILSSLTSVMKTGVSPAPKPSPGTPTTPTSNLGGAVKPPAQTAANPLANILSKVEITPESILSALSKTQVPSTPNLQGLSSLIQSVALHSGTSTISTSTAPLNTAVQTVKDRSTPSVTPPFLPKPYGYSPTNSNPDVSSTSPCKPNVPPSANAKPPTSIGFPSQPCITQDKMVSQPSSAHKPPEEVESSSLELKIHNFLKGNPGFSGLDLNIPILSGLGPNAVAEPPSEFNSGPSNTSLDNVDGTPVRDERSGTPTQDEIMDKPTSSNVDSVSLLSKIISPGSSTPSSTRSPLLTKDSEFQKLTPYRPYGLGENSPNAYRHAPDLEKPSAVDSTLEKFFPDTSFHEDEDYRDFEYATPQSTGMGNLDKRPSKSILKSNPHLEPMEYQPNLSFSQDFRKSFKPPFITGEKGASLSPSSDRYGGYNLKGNNLEANTSSSPSKDDSFYPSDANHNVPMLHSQFSESAHVPQNRHPNLHPKNNNPPPPTKKGSEQSGQTLSASTTMEFKNMLKNASRRPSEEKKFGQASFNEDMPGRGTTAEDQSDEQYRIETRVSSSSSIDLPDSTEEKGAPIETLGYHNMGNMRYSGEPIKTVESMRVGMKVGRPHGMDGSRSGWFEMGSTGSSFDDGPSSAEEQPSLGGGPGYKSQYDEHLPRFPDSVTDFRTKTIPPFEHLLPPPPPPPPMVPPLDRGGPFQIEQTIPLPGLPPDLFPRDLPISSHIQSVEPPKILSHIPPPSEHGGNPFPIHHSGEHVGIPFSPPPRLDIRHPYSQDQQGPMEFFPMHPLSARDHDPLSRENSQHNHPPHGRPNEPLGPPPRDFHGGFGGPPRHGSHHMNAGGMRPQRPPFRPRDPYHSLKRPRPPFGRGSHFFSPKRPYYQPRY
ncbi:regulation of nuclear pre-mRNA domain-containing protein 2 [Phyllobates terribilis]|uniref:regulation of nuclear pre-mRNA domain-containing protein 2 n=1 Tax=Phyllobates terribilis TaxID=111132 RepID=UPI003CCA7703